MQRLDSHQNKTNFSSSFQQRVDMERAFPSLLLPLCQQIEAFSVSLHVALMSSPAFLHRKQPHAFTCLPVWSCSPHPWPCCRRGAAREAEENPLACGCPQPPSAPERFYFKQQSLAVLGRGAAALLLAEKSSFCNIKCTTSIPYPRSPAQLWRQRRSWCMKKMGARVRITPRSLAGQRGEHWSTAGRQHPNSPALLPLHTWR